MADAGPVIPPFFGQWESRERIGDILSGALRAEQDPLWARSGAADAAEYALWAEHLCGVACLRMLLAARGSPVPTAFALRDRMVRRGGYVVEPGGAIRGLVYAPAVAWLREEAGIAAEVRVDMMAEDVAGFVAAGGMFIASVHPWVRWPAREPPSRGGHLVLVFGVQDGALRFHNPSGDVAATQADARLRLGDFARFFACRGMAVPG